MHITLETDYAVRITGCLAENGTRMDAAKISEKTGVTLRFALKILRKLAAANIVKSYKGAKGGYELAKSPSEITLKNVIDSIEGEYCLNRCLKAESKSCSCSSSSNECKYRKIFAEITDIVNDKLEKCTFQDLCR